MGSFDTDESSGGSRLITEHMAYRKLQPCPIGRPSARSMPDRVLSFVKRIRYRLTSVTCAMLGKEGCTTESSTNLL